MDKRNTIIDKNTFNICALIHNLSKLDVEFLDTNHKSSLQLFSSEMPLLIKPSRKQTALFINDFLKDKAQDDYLYYTDNFQLSYLGVGLWEDKIYKGTIIVGPFLSNVPNDIFISNILEVNHLPLGHRLQLQQYYKVITILDISAYKNIGQLIINLTNNPLIDANVLFSEYDNLIFNKQEKNEMESENFYSEVEMRYKLEKQIQNAVEKGSKEETLRLMTSFQFNPSHRVPNNPLRAHKNLTFTFNTLLRIGAERGGVSPVYIHNISDKYAILIEKASSIAEIESLMIKMASDYCDLVKNQSTAGYSPVIQKAINYINFNFDNELSLNIIAQKINISPSHLSRQFKKDTNLTITEFINKRRIEEAKFLIKQSNNSITEIALMVGFENHNYFCSVFKNITSLTPKEYLNKNKQHI